MKSSEKTAAVRIFADLIKADRIIDTGEMAFYDDMRTKYGFTQDNEIAAMQMTFSEAIDILKTADEVLRGNVLADCAHATMSDGFCAHSEALLLIALRQALCADSNEGVSVLSVAQKDFRIDESAVLYVESVFDNTINRQIVDNFRNIYKELLLSGFHFVYIPNVINHYKQTDRALFRKMISFLMPSFPTDGIDNTIDSLLSMTTESFCKDILCNRLALEKLRYISPSLLIKIGNNYVGDIEYSNLLCIETDNDIVASINRFADTFSSMLSSDILTVPVGKEANNQYLYYGFYKQLLDIFLMRKNIRSRIVVDPNREDILLPDIGQKLGALSRRDKAMYVLFLILMHAGGFSFNGSTSKVQAQKPHSKIERLQRQYAMVYSFMGGDKNRVPDISSAEIRRPMFSRIKRSIMKMTDMLYNVNDYLITKNVYGIYNVNIDPASVYIKDRITGALMPLHESEIAKRVAGA